MYSRVTDMDIEGSFKILFKDTDIETLLSDGSNTGVLDT